MSVIQEILVIIAMLLGSQSQQMLPEHIAVVYLPSQVMVIYDKKGEEILRTRVSTGKGWHRKGRKDYRDFYRILSKDPAKEKAISTVVDKLSDGTEKKNQGFNSLENAALQQIRPFGKTA